MTLTGKQKGGIAVGAAALLTLVLALKAKAAPPVVVCTPGEEKCIGPDKCQCKADGTGWVVIVPNATECLPPLEKAILGGTVTDLNTHAVIEGIVVDCGGYTDTTGSDGLYRISDIPPGTYSVLFSDPSGRYEPKTY